MTEVIQLSTVRVRLPHLVRRSIRQFKSRLSAFADARWRKKVNDRRWMKTIAVCGHCCDVATMLNRSVCQGCYDEITGKTNGDYLLSGRRNRGQKRVRVLDENKTSGVPGRMGTHGVSGGQWDNILKAAEEDR